MRLKLTQPVLNYDGTPIMAGKSNPDGSAVIGPAGRQEQVPETLRGYLKKLWQGAWFRRQRGSERRARHHPAVVHD